MKETTRAFLMASNLDGKDLRVFLTGGTTEENALQQAEAHATAAGLHIVGITDGELTVAGPKTKSIPITVNPRTEEAAGAA